MAFGVLGQGSYTGYANSLWEYSSGRWLELTGDQLYPPFYAAPGAVLSVSAVGTAQGETAFAIASYDHSLFEYHLDPNNTTPYYVSPWSRVSTGTFQQVSAGLDTNGLATAFGVVTTGPVSSDVWEFDNNSWTAVTGRYVPVPPGVVSPPIEVALEYGVSAGLNGEVFALESNLLVPNSSVWLVGKGTSGWHIISTGSFAQVSATQTAAGADVVFGTLTDGSLWEYTSGPGVTTGWTELLTGGVASTATPLAAAP